jgi:alpha-1,3-rhamnosyl/mannosyltransferase
LPEELRIDLYVTGPDDFGGELQRLSSPSRIVAAMGDVSAEQLASYYSGALALVTTAHREGFGLPMLEAMAMGCPVVASATALPGVLAPAAWAFAAGSDAELRAAIESLLENEGRRQQFVKLGREIARSLTWDRCARATADVYREVLECSR